MRLDEALLPSRGAHFAGLVSGLVIPDASELAQGTQPVLSKVNRDAFTDISASAASSPSPVLSKVLPRIWRPPPAGQPSDVRARVPTPQSRYRSARHSPHPPPTAPARHVRNRRRSSGPRSRPLVPTDATPSSRRSCRCPDPLDTHRAARPGCPLLDGRRGVPYSRSKSCRRADDVIAPRSMSDVAATHDALVASPRGIGCRANDSFHREPGASFAA